MDVMAVCSFCIGTFAFCHTFATSRYSKFAKYRIGVVCAYYVFIVRYRCITILLVGNLCDGIHVLSCEPINSFQRICDPVNLVDFLVDDDPLSNSLIGLEQAMFDSC